LLPVRWFRRLWSRQIVASHQVRERGTERTERLIYFFVRDENEGKNNPSRKGENSTGN
jgi:hypothetical protein